jgi:hypothetical protein
MAKSFVTVCFLITVLLALGLMSSGGSVSEAAPLAGITDTPTATPTNTPVDTPTNTPTATPADTPTVPTDTPAAPTEPSAPVGTATPTTVTPVGTLTLPLTGHTSPTGLWLLLIVAGGALMCVAILAAAPRARRVRHRGR